MANGSVQATTHRTTQKEKTQRAFRAYLDLLDTADWILGELHGQFRSFDLTIGGFRMLELLYRKGPMSMTDATRERRNVRQSLDVIVRRLEERGWVRRDLATLPPVPMGGKYIPKARRGRPIAGRRMSMVRLTPFGEKFIGVVIPKHAKVVKAFMRAINAREQDSLSRICRKLRRGDVVRFISEMTHWDVEQ